MTVVRRGSRWHIDLALKDMSGNTLRLRRTTGPGTTKKEALEIEKKLRKSSPGGLWQLGLSLSNQEKTPFSGFAKYWYETYAEAYNKPSELRTKESILRVHLYPFFKDKDIKAIRTEDIHRFIALKKKEGLNPKSINNHLAVLRKLFNTALDWNYLERSPMQGIKALKTPPSDFDFFTEEESQAFLQAAEKHRPDWYPFFLTAFLTGMRLGELCGLHWSEVDFVRKAILVKRNLVCGIEGTPKSGRSREIPMHPTLEKVLSLYGRMNKGYVFKTHDGKPLTRNTLRKPFARILKLAGLRTIKFHDIRHSFASQLVMKGVPLKSVQELLGHADIHQTMRYSHLSPQVNIESISLLCPTQGSIHDTNTTQIAKENP